jgi:hypothetical protein
MSILPIRALVVLLSLERPLRAGNFAAIYDRVRRIPVGETAAAAGALERICDAVDSACLWYWKQVLCLQRSVATVILLRKRGIPAELVIGAQHMPFKAHAWVEVDGRVVNDRSYMSEMYSVLDRC